MSGRTPPHLLIVGAGSVGKRHLENFTALGARVSAIDPNASRLEEAAGRAPLLARHTSLDSALAAGGFDAAVICSPPTRHVEQSMQCLQAGLACLIEKPLGVSAQSVAPLVELAQRSTAPTLLGYTYRWWQPLRDMREGVLRGDIGTPRHVRCIMSAHLADWHPWERYQDFFMAKAALGGGALLDESHFLDVMLWIFGMPGEVYAHVEKLSDLDIDTDDNVDALLRYPSGLRVSIHLDLFGRPHEKSITISGDGGTFGWSFEPNELRLGREAGASWQTRSYQLQRNDMFVGVAREFLDVLARKAEPTCTLEDGLRVLEVIEAMRSSSASGRRIALGQRS
jgi:predicted dehydrogenase